MSQANIPPAPPHAPQLSAADAPINTFQTSHQTHPASSLPTAFQEAVPITEITPGSSIAAVAALTKPEPALLPPPTQSIQEDDAADDAPITTATSPPTTGSSVHITLLLTTGARHPFTIDQKYLKRRNVGAAGAEVDPFEISVYTMKELIWKDWRDEWETRPTSPASIRLIHFGKLLDDKTNLKDCRFQAHIPNVVHMTVKPQDIVEEEETTKGGKSATGRNGSTSRSSGLRCCIVM